MTKLRKKVLMRNAQKYRDNAPTSSATANSLQVDSNLNQTVINGTLILNLSDLLQAIPSAIQQQPSDSISTVISFIYFIQRIKLILLL